MIALTLVTALFIVTFVELSARAAGPNVKVKTAQTIVATWRCQDKIPEARTPARSPWKPHSEGFRRAELQRWQERWRKCSYILRERARQWSSYILRERARQWNWQSWLPDKWQRIAQCETQMNWQHYNSSYEGAFGFATSSWDNFKPAGYPDHANQASPWQQYQVALRIYARYGLSGWGCRNA